MNIGYEYIDKTKFTPDDWKDNETVEKILGNAILGFANFSNFKTNKEGAIQLRFQYDWSADSEGRSIPFTGVGYLLLDELLNGFSSNKQPIEVTSK